MLHALDLGANYWSLWTESENLRRYHDARPRAFETLQRRIGYRVRPSWVVAAEALRHVRARRGVRERRRRRRAGRAAGLRRVAPTAGCAWAAGSTPGHPHAGRLRQASFVLPPGLEGQKLRLRAEIEMKGGVRRPVRWACAQPLEADGSLAVELLRLDDPRWRKGI